MNFASINENKKTNILIIGGGITGISLAYQFINKNYDVILIEQFNLLSGVTSKTTAKITYLQDMIYKDICKTHDFKTAKLYYESQKDAIKLIKKIIKEERIECDFKKTNSITYTNKEENVSKIKNEMDILDKLKVKYNKESKVFDKEYKALIEIEDVYTFNPIKYLNHLIKLISKSNNIKIYENSRGYKIKKEDNYYVTLVNGYEVKSNKVVLACNYPFFTIPGLIPFKTYLEKSYVATCKADNIKNYAAITSDDSSKSFRFYEDKNNKYYIYLTNSSSINSKLNNEKNYDEVCNDLNNKVIYKWMNMDVMSNDYLPIIGSISSEHKNVFIATGYNTWGMTNGTISSKVLFNLLRGKKDKYKNLFDPTRGIMLNNVSNFMVNTLLGNLKAYSFNLVKKNYSWYKNKVFVINKDGKRVGVYVDDDNKKHIVSNVCPHLKCFLTFNMVDKTWDCPCHGSRYDIDGNIVKGPSVADIKLDNDLNN